ncbi:MAG: hypothetical protein ACT4PP_15735 [Sporichthyaceae bacterium]
MDAAMEAWLSATVMTDFGPAVGYDPLAQEYFRRLWAEQGPLTGEDLWLAAAQHQLELAADAVIAVLADLSATLPERSVHIEPVLCGSVVRVSVDGRFSSHDGGRLVAFGADQALHEVAATVQDLLTEAFWMVWPECPAHARGLLAEAGSPPAWVCRAGNHTLGVIGGLRASGQAAVSA